MDAAVFLDRDGTLIEDRGYLRDPDEVVFYPETVPALRRLQERFALFLVTNQAGVARGLITLEEARRVNAHVVAVLARAGVTIREVYCCPHEAEDRCLCRKPNRFFADLAARDHGIELRRSYMIGDHLSDVRFAREAGVRGIFVLTGHGLKHRAELAPEDPVAAHIGEAAEMILREAGERALHQSPVSLGDRE